MHKPLCKSGRGGPVVRHTVTWLVSDHPVCGAKVSFAENFLDAAATPPHEEGIAAPRLPARVVST